MALVKKSAVQEITSSEGKSSAATAREAEAQRKRARTLYKSLHKPLTYLGVERTLFYFVCVGAVGVFNLFNSLLAGVAVFIGGFAFGHWVTNTDPAFLRILAKSERYNVRYDAAKQSVPRVEVI